MTGRRSAAALALSALAGAACAIIGGGGLSDAQQVIADLKLGPSDLAVVGGVDRAGRTYRVGEPIGLSAEVNQPAYVAVLRVLPNGTTTLLFPNKHHPAAQLAANAPLRIADPGSALAIAAETPGVVLFEFIAASDGRSWLFSRKPQGAADFAELGATTRAIAKDIVDSLKPGPGRKTALTHLVVRVEAR